MQVSLSAARQQLDSMIVEIELTLISIIQGVALTFLIEATREVVSFHEILFWPYVLSGLLVIFVFWSRSVLHIITVIRWPLEFGHNFLYIACALVEALLFTRLHHPAAWFALGAVFGLVGWALFIYDLRLIRARAADSAGPASNRMVEVVSRDQMINIALLLPGIVLFHVVCYICIRHWPALFLARGFHMALALVQFVAFAGYLLYVVRHFRKIAPLVAAARAEWQSSQSGSVTQ
jgi:hypothetical protein